MKIAHDFYRQETRQEYQKYEQFMHIRKGAMKYCLNKKKWPTRWVVEYIKTASDKQFSKFYWNVHCTQYRERKRVSQIREKNPAQYNRKIIPAIGQIALKIIIKSYQYNNIIYCISCEMYIWNYKNWSWTKKNLSNRDIPRI